MPKKTGRESRNKIALVTGATSGIGKLLIGRLLQKKYEVRVILRKGPKEHPEWRKLPKGVKVYVADIVLTDHNTIGELEHACKDVDVLFHIAGITYNYRSSYGERVNSNVMINTNVIGTENMLQAYADSNRAGRLKVVFASSVAVYGNKRTGEVLTEESEPLPRSAYSESKYMAEQVIKAFAAANSRLKYTIMRIGVMYGEGYERSFMQIFRLLKERKLVYVGGGDNHLTLIHVDDVVDAMVKAAELEKSDNKIYNLTDGVPHTQKELFRKAARFIGAAEPSRGVHPLIARIGARARGIESGQFSFLVSDRVVSIDKLKRELGFRPSVSIDKGGKELAGEFLKRYKEE